MTIKVADHDFFERKGKDISSVVSMTLSEALLGCKMTIATVHGPINITTEPGVSSDD
jgi:DnaJ-class molecular chaperone